MYAKLKELKEWILNLDYSQIELPAPKEKNIVLGTVDLSRYESDLIISIIPETEEESEQYNFNDGQGIQLELTVTILCRGQSQEKLVETMSAYTDYILDEIRKDCTLGNIGEGSAIGTRKFYLDAGTVENQLTASETTLTLLYIRKYE